MNVSANHYLKRSAFQAVYLVAFILASFSLIGSLLPITDVVVAAFADRKDLDYSSIVLRIKVLLVVVQAHWIRLYITLEQMEDDLERGDSNLFDGWWPSLRFVEFISRCFFVAWIGLKVVSGAQLDVSPKEMLDSFFAFLFGLYAFMVIWGLIYLLGELTKTGGKRPDSAWSWFKLVGIKTYLILSAPATFAFYGFPDWIQSTTPGSRIYLSDVLSIVILLMLAHLVYDAICKRDEWEVTWKKKEDWRLWKYFEWVRLRIAGDEVGFCLFFLSVFAFLRVVSVGLGEGVALGRLTVSAPGVIKFSQGFSDVAKVVLFCCCLTAASSWWTGGRTFYKASLFLSMLIALFISHGMSVHGSLAKECYLPRCESFGTWVWMALAALLAVLGPSAAYWRDRRTAKTELATEAPPVDEPGAAAKLKITIADPSSGKNDAT